MPAAGVVMIVAVVFIVAAIVLYLVATIVALRKITASLDDAIGGVGEIIEKSAPVAAVVADINANLDAGVDLLEGLLVKKAGLTEAVGLIDGLYPGAAAAGLRQFPESKTVKAPRIAEVYTRGHADAGAAGTRGADRRRLAQRPGAAQPGLRLERRPDPVPGRPGAARQGAAALAGDRDRITGAVRPR